MAAQVQNGDIVRILWASVILSQAALNRVYYRIYAVTLGPTDLDVASTLDTNTSNLFKACLSSAATYRGVSAQLLRPLVPPGGGPPSSFTVFQAQAITGGSGAGTRGATPMPGQVSGIIGFKGALAHRGLNPRLYMPWPSTNDATVNPMQPTVLYNTALGTLATAIRTTTTIAAGSGAGSLQLIDFQNIPASPVREDLITSDVPLKWATQRRRGAYGKPNNPPF